MNVVEKDKNCVRIPIWIITLLTPLILSLVGFVMYQTQVQQRILNTLEFHDRKLNIIEAKVELQVSQREVKDLKAYMIRIEDKVDRLIERNN